ncbi:Heat shock protein GrpE [hydrothermal vent metagenome]|uniref:Heat shock protein GrpE n=1 Tax=hydrothermal vent metagenome TaxID=652676 RepID=A0A3B0V9I4_9ZZZZ
MSKKTEKKQAEIKAAVEEVMEKVNQPEDIAVEEVEAEVIDTEEMAKAEIDTDNEAANLKEEIMRLRAEMDNIRKRNARELDNLRKYSLDKFAKALIPVADSLDKALEVSNNDSCQITAEQLVEGTEMTQKVFLKVLADNGVEVMNPLNEKFNPEFHEAMTQVPNPDLQPNTIIDVFQKGYILNGRLIRPAMVVVSK